jgi:hypothetical protein
MHQRVKRLSSPYDASRAGPEGGAGERNRLGHRRCPRLDLPPHRAHLRRRRTGRIAYVTAGQAVFIRPGQSQDEQVAPRLGQGQDPGGTVGCRSPAGGDCVGPPSGGPDRARSHLDYWGIPGTMSGPGRFSNHPGCLAAYGGPVFRSGKNFLKAPAAETPPSSPFLSFRASSLRSSKTVCQGGSARSAGNSADPGDSWGTPRPGHRRRADWTRVSVEKKIVASLNRTTGWHRKYRSGGWRCH